MSSFSSFTWNSIFEAGQAKQQANSYRAYIYRHLACFMLTAENCSNDPFIIAYAFIAIKATLFTPNTQFEKEVHTNTHIHRSTALLPLKFCLSCHINFCISSNFMLYQLILAFHYNPCVSEWVSMFVCPCAKEKRTTSYQIYPLVRQSRHYIPNRWLVWEWASALCPPSSYIWWAAIFFFCERIHIFWCLFAC